MCILHHMGSNWDGNWTESILIKCVVKLFKYYVAENHKFVNRILESQR